MRAQACAFAICATLVTATADAHGPQIQITNDAGKIVTRQLIADAPYSNSLTASTSVYVMPLLDFNGVWYSRPNGAIDPILGVSAFPSGPGFAYGYDLADGGAQQFDADSILSLGFTSGLTRWNGTAFVDAAATQLKAFRGSSATITSPATSFATTSDSGPFDSLDLPAAATSYGSEGAEVHTSLRFAMLGDGSDPLSDCPDGVYLLGMRLTSNQGGLAPSDPYYFVLYKNTSINTVSSAVNSLGVSASAVQWLNVPEPASVALVAIGLALVGNLRFRRRRGTDT